MEPRLRPSRRNYNNTGSYNNGFMYKIMPLSFNLQLKGNDHNTKSYSHIFMIGDYVLGTCIDDKKEYKGEILNIIYHEKTSKPYLVYVLDIKTRTVKSLLYKSLFLLKNKNVYEKFKFDNCVKRIYKKINNKKEVLGMNKYKLYEDYTDNTDLMNTVLKNQLKQQKKFDKETDKRINFIITILGKLTYNKYANHGLFAPVPLSALHLTFEDFYKLFPENNVKVKMYDNEKGCEKTNKLMKALQLIYTRNDIKFIDNGYGLMVHTDIVFKTLDDIIDFFLNIYKCIKKYMVNKQGDVCWTIIIKKFRNYLK